MLRVIVSFLLLHFVYSQSDNPKKFIYNVYEYDTRIQVTVNNETEQILDFKEQNELFAGYPTRVHISSNDSLSPDYPVFITATQQKGVSSWEMPLIIEDHEHQLLFNDIAETLCPHDAGPDLKTQNPPTVHISTESSTNTTVDIKLKRVTEFYVEINKNVTINVSPSTPKYYFFSFDQNPWNVTYEQHLLKGIPIFNYTIPKSVILVIDSSDELCTTVSIQNNSCPIFDHEKSIMYQGYHLTMTSKGGITLTQTMFPYGFYVVFIVKVNDAECTGASETAIEGNKSRVKTLTFRIIPTESYKEYVIGALVVASLIVLVAAFVVLVAVPFTRSFMENKIVEIEEPIPSTSQNISEEVPIINETINHEIEDSWSSPQALTVSKLCQASPDKIAEQSHRYFWGALTVAVVYALPVIQLLYTYQQMVFETGNQDLCYYNFLCAHPLAGMSDFNHVFSNVGYVALGVVFLAQVWARQRARKNITEHNMGIPQHFGLLYAMGLALIMEGFLSACYHLCPNKMNFQFDSSFMYVNAVLVMIKLYQNRHSDLIPSAHSTFMVLAFIMAIGVTGILFPSTYFSVLFTILHLTTCFVLTLKIYYAGKFKLDWSIPNRCLSHFRTRRWLSFRPAHTARAVLLALANVANWTFAIYCAYEHNRDLARQLLAILMGNAVLYSLFYVAMKWIHKERLLPHAWFYYVLSHVAWFVAIYLFIHGNTRWSETPAMSRRRNAECSTLKMFDFHDVWHITSAAAMFLSFNMLLTVDDALAHTPRDKIATF